MHCDPTAAQLGAYLDDELPSAARDELEAHLAACRSCRAELESLHALVSELAAASNVSVPEPLWTAIEHRLDDESRIQAPKGKARGPRPAARRLRLGGLSLALAAAVGLAVGLRMFDLIGRDSEANAATVDFSVLLNALPLDAEKAFRKFLVLYGAREGSPISAKRYAPELNFDVPDTLPGGFQLHSVYLLRFGEQRGVAATYEREDDFLGMVFHPPVNKEHFGPHRDYPCVIGRHKGHKVSVGPWRLVHLTDPTTCHCVLSRLDEQTELPAVMASIAPGAPPSPRTHRRRP